MRLSKRVGVIGVFSWRLGVDFFRSVFFFVFGSAIGLVN